MWSEVCMTICSKIIAVQAFLRTSLAGVLIFFNRVEDFVSKLKISLKVSDVYVLDFKQASPSKKKIYILA